MSPTSVEQRPHQGSLCSELAELVAAAGLVPERRGHAWPTRCSSGTAR